MTSDGIKPVPSRQEILETNRRSDGIKPVPSRQEILETNRRFPMQRNGFEVMECQAPAGRRPAAFGVELPGSWRSSSLGPNLDGFHMMLTLGMAKVPSVLKGKTL